MSNPLEEMQDPVLIVVPGRPEIVADVAEGHAEIERLCEESQQDHTMMMVPRSALDNAVIAQYQGVVLRGLNGQFAADSRHC